VLSIAASHAEASIHSRRRGSPAKFTAVQPAVCQRRTTGGISRSRLAFYADRGASRKCSCANRSLAVADRRARKRPAAKSAAGRDVAVATLAIEDEAISTVSYCAARACEKSKGVW
jgi:hypothetical protein